MKYFYGFLGAVIYILLRLFCPVLNDFNLYHAVYIFLFISMGFFLNKKNFLHGFFFYGGFSVFILLVSLIFDFSFVIEFFSVFFLLLFYTLGIFLFSKGKKIKFFFIFWLWLFMAMGTIDYLYLQNESEPLFMVKVEQSEDYKSYFGLGYKGSVSNRRINDYEGEITIKFGLWFFTWDTKIKWIA